MGLIEPEVLSMKQSGFDFTGKGLLKILRSIRSYVKAVRKAGYVIHL